MTLHHRCRPSRGLVRLGLVAAAVVAGAGAFAVAGRPLSAPSVTRCDPRDVVVWLEGRGNATAGSVYYTLGLTNLSGRRCSLRGYPGVSALDLHRRQLGSAAGRTPGASVRTVLIAPGRSAQVRLQLNDPGVFPSAACRPVTAAGLRVYLPDATAASVVPVPFGACSRKGPPYLHVSAVTA